MDAKEGDFIISLNGQSLKDVPNIYSLLIGKTNQQVALKLNSTPNESGARNVTVVPISDEQELLYYTWVQKILTW